ncbi:unnamed protein product [Rotaria magnacalcarata]|uniref:Uncharacterized protein n=2 Tax=Rotaria magnacalcarata TaxID=392030 RepID=A0A816MPY3_9BILA|nr:unnamed protein product [Rotaria magnacalcarata]
MQSVSYIGNSKRKTIDSYFSLSTEKKSKSPHEQRNYANDENAIIQLCDSHTSHVTIDIDEPIETPSIASSQTSILKILKKCNLQKKSNNKTIGNVIDISISCQDRPAQPKLSSYPKKS